MMKGSCHCGAVRFTLKHKPEWLTECNCSICRRIGVLWAHAAIDDIEIQCDEGATSSYIQGDKTLATHTCKCCGCTTHWESLQPEESPNMAVNCRMLEREELKDIRIRQFDGADTWAYLN
jgi:hypothetical protein